MSANLAAVAGEERAAVELARTLACRAPVKEQRASQLRARLEQQLVALGEPQQVRQAQLALEPGPVVPLAVALAEQQAALADASGDVPGEQEHAA